ncbi:spore germination protein [Ureibacillus acetophenoni]|uniref:Spore germination protein n=1 Tax=Ureibacillus acetophenoni TaxID=614649 RepID=A0A285UD94_9BACL|nr:spore germination protein [Ureibacillus acetophenoni]SOC39713.1 spore germination protein [Ureibacillus acetophenoni]
MSMRYIFTGNSNKPKNNNTNNNNSPNNKGEEFSITIEKDLAKNIETIKTMLGNPSDLVVRETKVGSTETKCAILYISGITNSDLVNNNILKAVQSSKIQSSQNKDQSNNNSNQSSNDQKNNQSNKEQSNNSQSSDNQTSSNKSMNQGTNNSQLNNDSQSQNSQSNNNNQSQNSQSGNEQSNNSQSNSTLLDQILTEVIAITDSKKVKTLDELSFALLSGNSIFILDGEQTTLIMDTVGGEKRSIDEPQSESVIRGSRVGFVENINTNLSLIRKEIKDPNLRFDIHEIGRRSKQKLAVCYVAGIVNEDILDEVNRRLKTIDIDFAPDSGVVEQWIEDSFLSPFPQILDTERPDRLTYNILQGKIGILVDGSPFGLITPITLGDALLSIEDYNQRWLLGSLLRFLRYISAFIAVFLPAIYVALIAYHPGMIPSQLTFSIAATRENVPFPAIVEVLLMAVTFEILQEAGIRMPKAIGATIGIVGGIVIGEVAVSAGIVGPATVIVTSLTGIATFTIPNNSLAMAVRVIRYALLIGASILGLYGIILVFILLAIHVVNLKSMGIPYSSPFAPYFLGDLKNLLIRAPITTLTKRPPYLKTDDIKKINDGGQSSK